MRWIEFIMHRVKICQVRISDMSTNLTDLGLVSSIFTAQPSVLRLHSPQSVLLLLPQVKVPLDDGPDVLGLVVGQLGEIQRLCRRGSGHDGEFWQLWVGSAAEAEDRAGGVRFLGSASQIRFSSKIRVLREGTWGGFAKITLPMKEKAPNTPKWVSCLWVTNGAKRSNAEPSGN